MKNAAALHVDRLVTEIDNAISDVGVVSDLGTIPLAWADLKEALAAERKVLHNRAAPFDVGKVSALLSLLDTLINKSDKYHDALGGTCEDAEDSEAVVKSWSESREVALVAVMNFLHHNREALSPPLVDGDLTEAHLNAYKTERISNIIFDHFQGREETQKCFQAAEKIRQLIQATTSQQAREWSEEDAAEIWAMAQLLPQEGIEDGIERILKFLKAKSPAAEKLAAALRSSLGFILHRHNLGTVPRAKKRLEVIATINEALAEFEKGGG